jgi:hypothetical protein
MLDVEVEATAARWTCWRSSMHCVEVVTSSGALEVVVASDACEVEVEVQGADNK